MNKLNELQQLIDEVHSEAATFARKKETPKLLAATEWLGRATELEKRFKGLLSQAEQLIGEWREPSNWNDGQLKPVKMDARNPIDEDVVSNLPGGKARASEYRSDYITREKSRGKILTRVRSIYFKTELGTILGITWKGKEKNKWFLNLQDGQFDEAVLLCEITHESAQVIHLTKAFFNRYGRHLSQDEKGQVKFNVERRNGRFFLQVPGYSDLIDVMDYADKEPLICKRLEFV